MSEESKLKFFRELSKIENFQKFIDNNIWFPGYVGFADNYPERVQNLENYKVNIPFWSILMGTPQKHSSENKAGWDKVKFICGNYFKTETEILDFLKGDKTKDLIVKTAPNIKKK